MASSKKQSPRKTDKQKLQKATDLLDKRQSRELTNCSIRAVGGENDHLFRLSFSSEEPYERWFGPEILDHSDGSIDLTRLNSIGCTLFNHDCDKVAARINRAWIENSRGEAEIEFDPDDEDTEKLWRKIAFGTIKGVSVGYIVHRYEQVDDKEVSKDGRFKGPCYIATKWEPLEISIVSIPADPTVGVGRSCEDDDPECGDKDDEKACGDDKDKKGCGDSEDDDKDKACGDGKDDDKACGDDKDKNKSISSTAARDLAERQLQINKTFIDSLERS